MEQNINTINLENKLNIKIYNLYELTTDEIDIIDPDRKFSQTRHNAVKIDVII